MPTDAITIETITTEQLAVMLQLGGTNAQEIMRGIKSVSDTLGVKGVCHRQDYEEWLKVRKGRKEPKGLAAQQKRGK